MDHHPTLHFLPMMAIGMVATLMTPIDVQLKEASAHLSANYLGKLHENGNRSGTISC